MLDKTGNVEPFLAEFYVFFILNYVNRKPHRW